MTPYWATSLFAGRPASGTECFEVRIASEVDTVLAEKDAEISKLREQVGTLRECREKWESCVSIEPPCHEDIEAAEAADDKARACGAL